MPNNKIKFILLILILILGKKNLVSKNNLDIFYKLNIDSGSQHLTHENNGVTHKNSGFNKISGESPHASSPEIIDKKKKINKEVSTRSGSDVTPNLPVIH